MNTIAARINKFNILRKQQNQALLDATKFNPYNLHGERQVNALSDPTSKDDKKVQRLKPWLDNANKNITHSHQLLVELRRVKVLKVTKDKFLFERKDLVSK